jgi:hypothetical protein
VVGWIAGSDLTRFVFDAIPIATARELRVLFALPGILENEWGRKAMVLALPSAWLGGKLRVMQMGGSHAEES